MKNSTRRTIYSLLYQLEQSIIYIHRDSNFFSTLQREICETLTSIEYLLISEEKLTEKESKEKSLNILLGKIEV